MKKLLSITALFLMVIINAGCSSEGKLHITSDVTGADIFINDEKKGITGGGVTIITVDEGEHEVRVFKHTKEWDYEGIKKTFVADKSSIEVYVRTSQSPTQYTIDKLEKERIAREKAERERQRLAEIKRKRLKKEKDLFTEAKKNNSKKYYEKYWRSCEVCLDKKKVKKALYKIYYNEEKALFEAGMKEFRTSFSVLKLKKYLNTCKYYSCKSKYQGEMVRRIIDDEKDFKNKFIDNKNSTITDKATGLTWIRCVLESNENICGDYNRSSYYSFRKTLQKIKSINTQGYASHNDWRLPTVKEYLTIVGCKNGINKNFTPPHYKENACNGNYSTGLNSFAFTFGNNGRYWMQPIEFKNRKRYFSAYDDNVKSTYSNHTHGMLLVRGGGEQKKK